MSEFASSLASALQHHQTGELERACRIYEALLGADPDHAEALHLLGVLRHQMGDNDQALDLIRRAVDVDPDNGQYHYNLGVVLQDAGHCDEAEGAYRRCIERSADHDSAYVNLGNLLRKQGRFSQAAACYEQSLAIAPGRARVLKSLGNVLKMQGRIDEAIDCFRQVLAIHPQDASAHSELVFALQYRPGVTAAELSRVHRQWNEQHGQPLRCHWRAHGNPRDPQRPLRVGFVSPDFGHHPVGIFAAPVLEHLDRRDVFSVCYGDRSDGDEQTARIQAAAGLWRDVYGMSDERLADQIRADAIDILIDLAGHTDNNRMPLLARKPAPIQMTWAGYVGTTGLEAMDYLICDRFHVPSESEAHYTEYLVFLPDGYLCYEPPGYAPEVGPLPALNAGHVTFGSLNNASKINEQVADVWAEILRGLPQSRLVLKYKGLDDNALRERIGRMFQVRGVDPQRIEMRGMSVHVEHLATYQRIDISLDTFPYSGGLTTCESVWMGVPVVTCPGDTFASRHSYSHLHNADCPQTVAGNLDEYVRLALRLANDLPEVAALRGQLRPRMAQAPLCDVPRFTTHLAESFRVAWQRWCAS